jgi:hypothetical protein
VALAGKAAQQDSKALQVSRELLLASHAGIHPHMPIGCLAGWWCTNFCRCSCNVWLLSMDEAVWQKGRANVQLGAPPLTRDMPRLCRRVQQGLVYSLGLPVLSPVAAARLVTMPPQVLLHCCRCCPTLCEAAAATGLHEVLLRLATSTGSCAAAVSLMVLSAVVAGVAASISAVLSGTGPAAAAAAAGADGPALQQRRRRLAGAVQALGPSQATDAVIVKLSGGR